ncbi:hypothetical protein ABT301_22360 [Streptomyces sp. NPDC000987]|uniref:hypothetical protein n=1 Tax=Streptomyces sp. NPDC000987 TaxID=3154374 RepID=UPI00331B4248
MSAAGCPYEKLPVAFPSSTSRSLARAAHPPGRTFRPFTVVRAAGRTDAAVRPLVECVGQVVAVFRGHGGIGGVSDSRA